LCCCTDGVSHATLLDRAQEKRVSIMLADVSVMVYIYIKIHTRVDMADLCKIIDTEHMITRSSVDEVHVLNTVKRRMAPLKS